jgi:MoaA/NifB/PqqE/SkfB family radical SAM enzyme
VGAVTGGWLERTLGAPGRLAGELARRLGRRPVTLPDRPPQLPVLVLFPHSRCNCRCVMCDIWKADRDRRELTEADLAPHLEAVRRLGVRWVVLSGGEPLMHSNLWKLCAPLETLGVTVSLLSTGLLLQENAAEVVRWCDEVIVSLDGPREIHDAIRRVPGAFDRLAAGVAALRAESGGFRVTARCVVQKRNFRFLDETIGAAADLALDQISFLAADTTSTAFNRPQGWSADRAAEVALDRGEVVELATVVDRAIRDHAARLRSGFVAEPPAKLRGLVRHYADLVGAAEPAPRRCNAPWVSAVVEADGTVRPCFFHRSFGNIADRPLDEILLGDDAAAFRRALDVARDPICRRCVCTLWLEPGATPPRSPARVHPDEAVEPWRVDAARP